MISLPTGTSESVKDLGFNFRHVFITIRDSFVSQNLPRLFNKASDTDTGGMLLDFVSVKVSSGLVAVGKME